MTGEIKICSAPLSEQHSSAGLDAAARGERKAGSASFSQIPREARKTGREAPSRKTHLHLRTRHHRATERGSLRAHLAELVAGPSIAALYPPRVGLPCAILPRPRERQAAGWLLHCPLQSSQQLVVHGRRRGGGVSLSFSLISQIYSNRLPTRHDSPHRQRPPPITIRVGSTEAARKRITGRRS